MQGDVMTNTEQEMSPAEEKAREGGWVDKEEWIEQGKDPSEWITAYGFNRDGELMERIRSQGRELQETKVALAEIPTLKAGLKELGEHNQKIAQQEYDRAMRDLKKDLKAARLDADVDAETAIEESIDALKESKPVKKEPEKAEPPQDPYFIEWQAKDENKWFHTDLVMRGAVEAIAVDYLNKNPNSSSRDVIEHAVSKLKEEMPGKFKKPQSVVDANSRSTNTPSKRKSKYSVRDLTDDQKAFGKTFVETGAFKNIQEYVDQLAETGEIG